MNTEYEITAQKVADALREIRKTQTMLPVGTLQCGDQKKASKAIRSACADVVGRGDHGIVSQFLGLPLLQRKDIPEDHLYLLDRDGEVFARFIV